MTPGGMLFDYVNNRLWFMVMHLVILLDPIREKQPEVCRGYNCYYNCKLL